MKALSLSPEDTSDFQLCGVKRDKSSTSAMQV